MTKAEEISLICRVRHGNGCENTVVYLRDGKFIHYVDARDNVAVSVVKRYPWVGIFNGNTGLGEIEAGLARVMGERRAA